MAKPKSAHNGESEDSEEAKKPSQQTEMDLDEDSEVETTQDASNTKEAKRVIKTEFAHLKFSTSPEYSKVNWLHGLERLMRNVEIRDPSCRDRMPSPFVYDVIVQHVSSDYEGIASAFVRAKKHRSVKQAWALTRPQLALRIADQDGWFRTEELQRYKRPDESWGVFIAWLKIGYFIQARGEPVPLSLIWSAVSQRISLLPSEVRARIQNKSDGLTAEACLTWVSDNEPGATTNKGSINLIMQDRQLTADIGVVIGFLEQSSANPPVVVAAIQGVKKVVMGAPKVWVCWNCSEPGHRRVDCPHPEKSAGALGPKVQATGK